MKIFSVPADFQKESLQVYDEMNKKYEGAIIKETYGQLTEASIHMSGRAMDIIPNVSMKELENYVDYSLKRNIDFNYTLNAACLGNYEFTNDGIKEIKELLKYLTNIGVKNLTLTTPAIIELIKHLAPDMNIKVSAICQIDSVEKMKHYLQLGIERFVLEPSIIKNFPVLKNMTKLGSDKMEIILNDKCMRNCPFRIFHYNQTAHDNSKEGESYYFMNCGVEKSRDLLRYLNLNWVRPEDLYLYQRMGIQYLKIEGREFVRQGNIKKLLEAYIDESFEGNLLDLLHVFAPYDTSHQPYIDNKNLNGYVEGFYKMKVVCNQMCDECGYCRKYMEKSFLMPKEMSSKAISYYKSKNLFLKKLESELN